MNLNLVPIHNLGLLDTNDLRTQQTGLLFCDDINRNSVLFSYIISEYNNRWHHRHTLLYLNMHRCTLL